MSLITGRFVQLACVLSYQPCNVYR